MATDPNFDSIRSGVLRRMEQHARHVRLAIAGGVILELLMLGIAGFKLEFSNRVEVVMFALFVLTYTLIVLGMFALGAHVSRVGDRVLAALAERERT
jgi:hypothetical protein